MSESTVPGSQWFDIPMGPQTQMFLGLDAEADLRVVSEMPTAERFAEFSDFLRKHIVNKIGRAHV